LIVFFGENKRRMGPGGDHFAVRVAVQIWSIDENQVILFLNPAEQGGQIHLTSLIEIVGWDKEQILQSGVRRQDSRTVDGRFSEGLPNGVSFHIQINQQAPASASAQLQGQADGDRDREAIQAGCRQKNGSGTAGFTLEDFKKMRFLGEEPRSGSRKRILFSCFFVSGEEPWTKRMEKNDKENCQKEKPNRYIGPNRPKYPFDPSLETYVAEGLKHIDYLLGNSI
jgi:hypothetical protein